MSAWQKDQSHDLLEGFRRKHGIPALGAAIVDANSARSVAVTGVRVRGQDAPVGRDDRWHIGSCGKSFTAALYARLVEGGTARWHATLPELFPDLAASIDAGWRDVTIEQVLTHRSGLPGNLSSMAMDAAYHDERTLEEQRGAVAASALSRPPRGVGSFRYSNLGYIVAGAAIERIAGRSWEDTITTELLRPLGMTSAGFGAPTGAHPWGHRPRWNRFGRGGPVDPGGPEHPAVDADNPSVLGPAGRIHLTLDDWARFIGLFLTEGGTLLQPGSVTRLTTPAPGGGPRMSMGWAVPRGALARRVAYGQQGSNTFWVATAVVARSRDRAAMVVCNDGRMRMLPATARLAADLLAPVPAASASGARH